ncbi:MAG: T9SS type A sorting domain-containing protein [Chitinophagaceae bacterium]
MRIANLALLLLCTGSLFAQTSIPISGSSSVYVGTEHTYVADLSGIAQTRGATVTWSVQGGVIVSAITDPAADSVYCVVRWSYSPNTFMLSATVNAPAQSGSKQVVVNCRQANAGNDVTICQGNSAVLGSPAVPGYSYAWRTTNTGLDHYNVAQPVARPAQTTTYREVMNPQSPNLLQNGDFENGYTPLNSDYILYPDLTNRNGTYEVAANPYLLNPAWRNMTDYSLSGHMLIADGSAYSDPSGYRFWYATVEVHPDINYSFSFVMKPLLTNNHSEIRYSFTGNNGGTALHGNIINPGTNPSAADWSAPGTSWYSGSNTRVTIEMRYLPVTGNPEHANQMAFDNIVFQEFRGCGAVYDDVIVSIGARPQVSPSGPIEYYYLEQNKSPQIGITLSADVQADYQWYKDNELISGATLPTYQSKSAGVYTVRSAGCSSEGVTFYDHAKGHGARRVIGEPLDFPAGIYSPSYYCYNSTSYIRQFDLGPSANYHWQTYTPAGASDQPATSLSAYNVHSPYAEVIIGGPGAAPATILGYAESKGYVKAMEFSQFIYSSHSLPQTDSVTICSGRFRVTNYNSFTSSEIDPGASGFQWETYDVGAGAEILVPVPELYPDPADPGNKKKIRIPGRGGYSGAIIVRFNTLPGRIKKYFYSDNGDCYQDNKRYTAAPGCIGSVDDDVSIYPNPSGNTVKITAPDDILLVELLDVNYSGVLQVIRSERGNKTLYLNISQRRQGVYNCRITTTGGVVNKKLMVIP